MYVGWDNAVQGMLVVSDMIRQEAAESIREIRQRGLAVSIISGDNAATTASIASMVDVPDVTSEASPIGKKEIIARMQDSAEKVMMVGDGINDAPGLTQSLVGVAMGRGTDIAIESADAVLVRNDLRLVPYLLSLSKKTYAVIRQSVFWSFFYNIIAIPLAVAGVLHPIIAAGAMAASSLFVVGNSLRLRQMRI